MKKTFFKKKQTQKLLLGLFTLLVCLIALIALPDSLPTSVNRVIVIIVFAIFFWGFEIVPLYATSIFVILGLTFSLQKELGFEAFLLPFSNPVIFLFLGGLTLAAAAHKHEVDRFLMEKMLRRIGRSTKTLILGILITTAFFSIWISNTAAAALMLLLIKPILQKTEKTDPFRKAMTLAIAFGANLGGIGSPIGSPPNAIAIGILRENGIDLNFLTWMMMTIPLMVLLLSVAAVVLFYFFPPKTKTIATPFLENSCLTKKGKIVSGLILLVIGLWLTKPLHHIPEDIVALIGVGLFTATRLISVKDFRNIQWDVLILIWGGLALGEGVLKSGLINELVQLPIFAQQGHLIIAVFCILAVLLTSFISNTATANLLLPLAISIAPAAMGFVSITVALACSLALMLPISTPPNALTYGSGAFRVQDMAKSGSVVSVLSLILILLGFEYVIPLVL